MKSPRWDAEQAEQAHRLRVDERDLYRAYMENPTDDSFDQWRKAYSKLCLNGIEPYPRNEHIKHERKNETTIPNDRR